jgi:hypothetical protein
MYRAKQQAKRDRQHDLGRVTATAATTVTISIIDSPGCAIALVAPLSVKPRFCREIAT